MSKEIARRLLLVVLAAWLAGTAAVWLSASNNFRHAKSVFATTEQTGLAAKLAPLGNEDAHQVMRHLASEINRSIFRFWDKFQVGVALAALWLGLMLPVSLWRKIALATMMVISLLLVLWITPTVLKLGPPLDFLPRDPAPPAFRTFMFYHALYLILDGIKMILLVALVVAGIRDPIPAPKIKVL